MTATNKNPLAEVFGFPVDNVGKDAVRYRKCKLCPYNNKVPSCTKDKAQAPLGVCSVFDKGDIAITCHVRFREGWLIAEDAADFFFPANSTWTSLTEVRLNDAQGQSAGNIDVVLVSYDGNGKVLDFGSLEIQAVYISGNVRRPFEEYLSNPSRHVNFDWSNEHNDPRPDYLSSSRKRLAPQLIYKGGILKSWNKKMAVALDKSFFNTLPELPEVAEQDADIAWFIYDLVHDTSANVFKLQRVKTRYTKYNFKTEKEILASFSLDNFVDLLTEEIERGQYDCYDL
ncbi:MAG: Restriction endonuclease NotI [Treponematales bacterium]